MTRFNVTGNCKLLAGQLEVPGDKSIGHRALLFGLLTKSPITVYGLGDGADNGRSAKAITSLGATMERVAATNERPAGIKIVGRGVTQFLQPSAPIDCGNSGTTIRLLCGMLAGQRFPTTLIGDESLSKRPMKRVIEPLAKMGAKITGVAKDGGSESDLVPPLVVGPATQPLVALEHNLAIASAQVKTSLLLASLFADGNAIVREPGPSRDHTERMLRFMGAPLHDIAPGAVELRAANWDRQLGGGTVVVPADPSSAAFLVVAACIVGTADAGVRIRKVMVNPTRTGFLEVLANMGAQISLEPVASDGPEPLADIVIRNGRQSLQGTTVSGDLVVRAIDEIPVLAVAAAFASGTTTIRNAEELRVKESDRIVATLAMLRSFGVECEELPDGMVISGCGGGLPHAGSVDAMADHRIAMAGAIAGLVSAGQTVVRDADNVATSYPGFVAALASLGAEIEVDRE